VHVPYKGGADAAKDFLAGRVQYYFDAAPNAIQNTATGKVRMLAVAAPRRSPLLPDVPTMGEQGVRGVDMPSWLGFYGPAHACRRRWSKSSTPRWRRCWPCRPRATSSARAPTRPSPPAPLNWPR
jgi:tripartite-type tricarboxylate transporter receptor subunit TctC